MPPSKAQLAKIHIAKKAVCPTDENYRDLLAVNFGASSAKELSEEQAFRLLEIFRQKGWKPSYGGPGALAGKRRDGNYIEIKAGPAAAQQRKVLAMWNALGYGMDKLHARCKKQFQVDRFEWLTDSRHLHVLITDLKKRLDALESKP